MSRDSFRVEKRISRRWKNTRWSIQPQFSAELPPHSVVTPVAGEAAAQSPVSVADQSLLAVYPDCIDAWGNCIVSAPHCKYNRLDVKQIKPATSIEAA